MRLLSKLAQFAAPAQVWKWHEAAVAGFPILGGKPAEMPFFQEIRWELVINLKAAKELGLDIPPGLVARADRVIE